MFKSVSGLDNIFQHVDPSFITSINQWFAAELAAYVTVKQAQNSTITVPAREDPTEFLDSALFLSCHVPSAQT